MKIDQKVYGLIKHGMDASVTRGKAIANNISNINTKGYKRVYVTFEESLQQATDGLGLHVSKDKHIQSSDSYGTIKVKRDESTSMRQDGNNVDIDAEMTNQAANTLMYNALIKELNSRLSMTSYVIKGGK